MLEFMPKDLGNRKTFLNVVEMLCNQELINHFLFREFGRCFWGMMKAVRFAGFWGGWDKIFQLGEAQKSGEIFQKLHKHYEKIEKISVKFKFLS